MATSKALRTSGRSKAISLTPSPSSTSTRCAVTARGSWADNLATASRTDHLAAVDIEDVAGNPRCLVRQQKEAHPHQIGRLSLSLEGQLRQNRFHEGIRH